LFAKIFLRQIRIKIIGVHTLENSFSFSQAGTSYYLRIIFETDYIRICLKDNSQGFIEIHPYSKLYN
ncbi:hypothetical protein, partial [Leptospira interrogans]